MCLDQSNINAQFTGMYPAMCSSINKNTSEPWTFFLVSLSNDGTEFGGSIYQKVNDELETAVTLAWTAGSNNTRFGIAAKYKLDKDASLSVSAPTTHLQLRC